MTVLAKGGGSEMMLQDIFSERKVGFLIKIPCHDDNDAFCSIGKPGTRGWLEKGG